MTSTAMFAVFTGMGQITTVRIQVPAFVSHFLLARHHSKCLSYVHFLDPTAGLGGWVSPSALLYRKDPRHRDVRKQTQMYKSNSCTRLP